MSLLVSSGCAVMGRQQKMQPINPEAVAALSPGMSKAEVTEKLGAPQEILFIMENNNPVRELAYVYQYTATKYTGLVFAFLNFGNSDEKQDLVTVFLNEEGQVSHIGATFAGENASYGFPFGR